METLLHKEPETSSHHREDYTKYTCVPTVRHSTAIYWWFGSERTLFDSNFPLQSNRTQLCAEPAVPQKVLARCNLTHGASLHAYIYTTSIPRRKGHPFAPHTVTLCPLLGRLKPLVNNDVGQ
jgi:hypothetical protein